MWLQFCRDLKIVTQNGLKGMTRFSFLVKKSLLSYLQQCLILLLYSLSFIFFITISSSSDHVDTHRDHFVWKRPFSREPTKNLKKKGNRKVDKDCDNWSFRAF